MGPIRASTSRTFEKSEVKSSSRGIHNGTVGPQLKRLYLVYCISNAIAEIKRKIFR
jgi:hypothetical protein